MDGRREPLKRVLAEGGRASEGRKLSTRKDRVSTKKPYLSEKPFLEHFLQIKNYELPFRNTLYLVLLISLLAPPRSASCVSRILPVLPFLFFPCHASGGKAGGMNGLRRRVEKKGEEGKTGGRKGPRPHHVLSSSKCRPPDASQGERTTTARSKRTAKRNKEVSHRLRRSSRQQSIVFLKEDLILSLLRTKTEEGEGEDKNCW